MNFETDACLQLYAFRLWLSRKLHQRTIMTYHTLVALLALAPLSLLPAQSSESPAAPAISTKWETVECTGTPHARHEAAFIAVGDKFYLLGGRRIQEVDIFDPATKTWTTGTKPPVEVHHFQPVVIEGKIWLVGAMTGKYPKEGALDHIPIYDPASDSWSRGPSLPEGRRRGGAGAVVNDGKLYVVCGIINGHWDGNVAWLDAYDLAKKEWSILPDAPHARDHYQAVVIAGKIYAAGGRQTNAASKHIFDQVVPEVDEFDIAAGTWKTTGDPIPTPRAGTASMVLNGALVVAGGESMAQKQAHDEVERFHPSTGKWDELPSLVRGRHGSGLILYENTVCIAAGCGSRGGKPELDSTEILVLPSSQP